MSLSGARRRRLGRRRQIPSFLHESLYRSLELSALLDALNQERDPEHKAASIVADSLMADGSKRRTVSLFNRHFGSRTIPLRLRLSRREGSRVVPWPDLSAESAVGLALWWFLTSPGQRRLKRCEVCPTYFFDLTRNGSKRHCSRACGSRATSRRYRSSS